MMLGAALRVELDRGITKSYGAEVPLAESYINTLSLSRLQVWQVDIRSLSRLIIWALLLDRSRIFFFVCKYLSVIFSFHESCCTVH